MIHCEEESKELDCQRELFSLEDGVHYLNCAAYSPFLTASKEAGVRAMEIKSNPQYIKSQDHFTGCAALRQKFATLIHCEDADRIAVFPSVSYGMAIVANNLHRLPDISSKRSIIILEEEFPNDTYAFERVASSLNLSIEAVKMPTNIETMGELWNLDILARIQEDTAAVVIPCVHWIYGVMFDLEKISAACKENGALLIIDGTQSVGALPFDVQKIKPDALIIAAYKWLLGPYSTGFGYFSSFFDDGVPLEESWMNRVESDNFKDLCNLQREYRPKAQRYNMGEFSQFIQCGMLSSSLDQLNEWGVSSICSYVSKISQDALKELRSLGCSMVSDSHRAPHVFGLFLPSQVQGEVKERFIDRLKVNRVYVSLRGDAIRVAINVFNSKDDLFALVDTLKSVLP